MATLQEIRDAIQAAHDRDQSGPYEGIAPFLAPEVETLHEPPFPNDGVQDGSRLAAFLPLERQARDAALDRRRMDVTFGCAAPDRIVMKGVISGVFVHDGSEMHKPVHVEWTVAGGQITRYTVYVGDGDTMEGYRQQQQAFQSPAVKPIYDEMMAVLSPPAGTGSPLPPPEPPSRPRP
jgi:ketosteroid isomerase-like protein